MSSEVPSVLLVPVGEYSTDTDANCDAFIADGAQVVDKVIACDWLFNVKKVNLNRIERDSGSTIITNTTETYERRPISLSIVFGNFIQTVDGKDRLATNWSLSEFSNPGPVGYMNSFLVFVYRGVWYRTAGFNDPGESDVLTASSHTTVNAIGGGGTITTTATITERFYP